MVARTKPARIAVLIGADGNVRERHPGFVAVTGHAIEASTRVTATGIYWWCSADRFHQGDAKQAGVTIPNLPKAINLWICGKKLE